MQLEVRRLQRRLGLTTIFITHDQEEALVLSDRIAVMNKGSIQQVASTTEIYERPANDFVADFVGESNIFHGTVTEVGSVTLESGRRLLITHPAPVGSRVGVLMRPERFGRGGANTFNGEVKEAVYLGSSLKLRLACDDGLELVVRRVVVHLRTARDGRGASSWRIFWRVYLPLTAPGIFAGATIVFVLSLGFFITPALLGGGKVMMLAVLIEQQIHQTLNWPFAAALSAVLLALTLGVYSLAQLFTRQQEAR
jgi:hypothetical protein